MRQLALKTQAAYIRAVSKLAVFTKQSPDTASAEELLVVGHFFAPTVTTSKPLGPDVHPSNGKAPEL